MFWFSLCALLALCSCDDFYHNLERLWDRERAARRSNLLETTFPSLKNRHFKATHTTETQYPWIARVVHSTSEIKPHVCTASCIDERLFVTAARCIFVLKVEFTSVYYQNQFLPVRAFVVPSRRTKQMFDDVGIIVVEDEPRLSGWATIKVFDTVKRTDVEYKWLQDMGWEMGPQEHYVVGYASEQETIYQTPETIYTLTELKIVIDMELCHKLTSFNDNSPNFWVPCYHSCKVTAEQSDKEGPCGMYHGVEGGAVIDKKNNTLLGVATWGGYYVSDTLNLPVGFSVLNSDSFFEDRECALRIRDSERLESSVSYQTLCER